MASPPSSLKSLCLCGLGMSTTPGGYCNTCIELKESNQQKISSCTNQRSKNYNKKEEHAKPSLNLILSVAAILAALVAVILALTRSPSCTESDHMLRQLGLLRKEYEGKMAELTEAAVQQKIQELQLKVRLKALEEEMEVKVEKQRDDLYRELERAEKVNRKLEEDLKQSQESIMALENDKQRSDQKIKEQQILSKHHTKDPALPFLSIILILAVILAINLAHTSSQMTAVAQLEKRVKRHSQEMKKLHDVVLRLIQKYAVNVTLDPDTAHTRLILSEDGKQVRHGDINLINVLWNILFNNTTRFSLYACVLGKQSFSSGRFYYEVQVRGKTAWDLGVARESINRGGDITVTPNNGYWSIFLRNGKYEALTDPAVLLPVIEVVQKVGVFVDYEEGLVSFYDVEARVHLYSFTGCTFTEKLYPFFSPCNNDGGKNSAPLIISPVRLA